MVALDRLLWALLSSPGSQGFELKSTAYYGRDLSPLQLGFGTAGGGEAAAHAARHLLQNSPNDHLLLKLDFKNAFNCLIHDKMLETVLQSAPLLFPFAYSVYESPTFLYYRNTILISQEGVQQGDPLGSLLFCLTIHPMVQQLKSRFKVFYMDDSTLGGNSMKF